MANESFQENSSLLHSLSAVNCSVGRTITNPVNAIPLLLSCLDILCQLFNLIGFHLWRDRTKQPFVQFHVNLAVALMITGLIGTIPLFTRLSPWTPVTVFIAKVFAVAGFSLFSRMAIICVLFISVDRWLSVEFPHWYRQNVTRRAIKFAIVGSWVLGVVMTTPGLVIYRDRINVSCNRPYGMSFQFNKTNGDSPVQAFFATLSRGIFLIPVLFIFQLRILMIVVETKLRMARMRQQTIQPIPGTSFMVVAGRRRLRMAHLALLIVWEHLLASMIVVLGTLLANLPFAFFEYSDVSQSSDAARIVLFKLQNYLFVVQSLYTPFVYLIFFPNFRAAVCRPLLAFQRWFVRVAVVSTEVIAVVCRVNVPMYFWTWPETLEIGLLCGMEQFETSLCPRLNWLKLLMGDWRSALMPCRWSSLDKGNKQINGPALN